MVIEDQRKWIFHRQLGWFFLLKTGMDEHGFGMNRDGWLWTAPDIWPFLWSNRTKDWLYLTLIKGNAIFYDYSTGDLDETFFKIYQK